MGLIKILVAGAASNCGKTAMCEILLRHLTSFAALKVTRVTEETNGCPRGGRSCGVCSSLGSDYELIVEPQTLFVEGTDTDRFHKAGACSVAWVVARSSGMARAWQDAEALFSGLSGVVIESNSILPPSECTLSMIVVNPSSRLRWKPSVYALVPKVDVVIVNIRNSCSPRRLTSVLSELSSLRGVDDLLVVNDLYITLSHPKVFGLLSLVTTSAFPFD